MVKQNEVKKALRGLVALVAFVTSAVVPAVTNAQTQKKVILYPNVVAECVGGYLEGLPDDYSSTNKNYPLLIFIHGLGEVGKGTDADLNKMYRNGPPNLLNNGKFPSSFTVNGQTFKMIVLSPQFNHSWPSSVVIQKFIAYAKSKYRVDDSRIYITGLSMGGGTTWSYASASVENAASTAAIVPVCGASTANQGRANVMASQNLPIWAFHNDGDPSVDVRNTTGYVNYFNQYTPKANPQAKMTIWQSDSHNAWSKAYDPAYREDGKNVYEWMLQYKARTSGQTPDNTPPTADAGTDQTITLPTSSVTLSADGSKDTDGAIASRYWSQTSGPATAKFSNQWVSNPSVSGLTAAGTYVFSVKITDNSGDSDSDEVQVIVKAAVSNNPPTVTVSNSPTITLPTSSATLTATAADSDGSIKTYQWTQTAGSTVKINSANSASTSISNFTVAGSYTFKITVTDDSGATASATATVTVQAAAPAPNTPPSANAGSTKTITLPTSSATLTSLSTDSDGKITVSYWTQVSGPTTANITNQWISSTTVTNLTKAGTYVFRLKVTDNNGATDETTVNIEVSPEESSSLKANAGDDFTVDVEPSANRVSSSNARTVSADDISVYLDGSASTGIIQTFYWYQVQGPNSANFGNAWYYKPKVLNLTYGTYKFVLRISDLLGVRDFDTVTVTVKSAAAGNQTLFSNAGSDITVPATTNSVTLDGSASYTTNYQIIGYNWSQISGPATVSIRDMWKNKSTATGFTKSGTYTFVLRVTDKSQASAYDTVKVTVGSGARLAGVAAGDSSELAMALTGLNSSSALYKTYPNPATSTTTLSLSSNLTGRGSLTIYNMAGVPVQREIFVKDNVHYNKQIDLSRLTAGSYFITIQIGEGKTQTLKIQKL